VARKLFNKRASIFDAYPQYSKAGLHNFVHSNFHTNNSYKTIIVCLFNSTSALFRLSVPRTVEIQNILDLRLTGSTNRKNVDADAFDKHK